ncbi:MAG: hypothetical protein L3J20_06655 [Flavobacteriaceae bacterium]|nr:hypothetical protein [Flavobacteriaceae bacterium]
MVKKGITIIFLSFLLLLTGCFEIVEEVSFNKDGSGHVTLTLNLSRSKTKLNSMMLLDSINNYKVPSEVEIQQHFTEITNTIKETKGISNVTNSLNFKEFIYTISCDFTSVEALNMVISNFSSKSEAEKIKQYKHFSFDKDKHKFTRNYHYDLAKEFNKTKMADRKIFENATFTTIYRFTDPIISSKNTTAKISGNKKAIFLKVNAQDIITNKNSIKNQIQLQD